MNSMIKDLRFITTSNKDIRFVLSIKFHKEFIALFTDALFVLNVKSCHNNLFINSVPLN
jgi:hypothetical protein